MREDVKMRRCEDEIQTPTIGRTLRSDALGEKLNGRQQCESAIASAHFENVDVLETLMLSRCVVTAGAVVSFRLPEKLRTSFLCPTWSSTWSPKPPSQLFLGRFFGSIGSPTTFGALSMYYRYIQIES